MDPIYKTGYRVPSFVKMLIKFCLMITTAYLLVSLIIYILDRNSIKMTGLVIVGLFVIFLLVIMAICMSYLTKKIYYLYNTYLLYNEKLTIKDRLALCLYKNDINKLETILTKLNYINIDSLEILIDYIYYMKTNDRGLDIKFKLNCNNQQPIIITVTQGTKEAYQSFLQPFIDYQINIIDKHNLIAGLNQPLRLQEYFTKSMEN